MDGGLANWFSVEPSMTAAFAVVHVTVTAWVFFVALGVCARDVRRAWAAGLAPDRRLLRALTRQTAAGPSWLARALAGWLALLWGVGVAVLAAAAWPLVVSPLLAFAYFFPATFKMALGAVALWALWFKVVRRFW